jgi:hypothetical protein
MCTLKVGVRAKMVQSVPMLLCFNKLAAVIVKPYFSRLRLYLQRNETILKKREKIQTCCTLICSRISSHFHKGLAFKTLGGFWYISDASHTFLTFQSYCLTATFKSGKEKIQIGLVLF